MFLLLLDYISILCIYNSDENSILSVPVCMIYIYRHFLVMHVFVPIISFTCPKEPQRAISITV